MKQEEFYQKLSEVPPVPDSLYPEIEKRIKQTRSVRNTIWALAASLILAVGITGFYYSFSNKAQTVASPVELSENTINELQSFNEYINGNSLDEEIEMYALVDIGLF